MILVFYDDIVQDVSPIGCDGDVIDIIHWADELLEDEVGTWNPGIFAVDLNNFE